MATQSRRAPQPVPRGRRLPLPLVAGASALALLAVAAFSVLALRGGDGSQTVDTPPVVAGSGVVALQPSADLGRVPLNTPVQHAFKLKNTGETPATLGQPRIETLEGC